MDMIPFPPVRRQDRLLNKERAVELLETGEYGFLSVGIGQHGYAYGIPLNFAYDTGKNTLYFHCAPEGHKLDIMKNNNKVSFCVVGNTKPLSGKFTTLYESVLVFAKADIHLSDDEKKFALRALLKKYEPEHLDLGEKYIEKSFHRTLAFKIEIEHITAKSKSIQA